MRRSLRARLSVLRGRSLTAGQQAAVVHVAAPLVLQACPRTQGFLSAKCVVTKYPRYSSWPSGAWSFSVSAMHNRHRSGGRTGTSELCPADRSFARRAARPRRGCVPSRNGLSWVAAPDCRCTPSALAVRFKRVAALRSQRAWLLAHRTHRAPNSLQHPRLVLIIAAN